MNSRLRTFDSWYSPALSRAFGSFDRLFDMANGLASLSGGPEGGIAADLYEDENHYYARVELPGVKKSEVSVSLEERLLSIGVERRTDEGKDAEAFRSHRALTVPEGVDGDKVSAKLEDGILTVTMPKAENRKPRSIKIK